jgi:glycosyltransferase involved in cell wall biosynthesis
LTGRARKLKVCIFTETYYPVVGGGETQARLLAEGLVKSGCPVLVLTRRSDPSLARQERSGEIRIHRLPPTGRHHLNKWGLLLSSFPALLRLRGQYDIILVSGFRVIGIAAVLVSKLTGKVCLLKSDNNGEMSGAFFQGGLQKAGLGKGGLLFKSLLSLRNRILRQAGGFIAISSQITDEYLANGVQPASKVYSIPNSVDTDIFRPVSLETKYALREKLDLPKDKLLVIFTGRLVSYKGLPLLLEVWKQIAREHPQAALILVGGGSMDMYNAETQLKEYVAANQLVDKVFFSGEVKNVHEYLQACDLFVFPTQKEAFGISVIEAMACGLPVIATQVGGLKDILVHGQNGWVIQPNHKEDLYQALNRLISDKELAGSLGKSALRTARSCYSVEMVTGKYLDLFQQFTA